LGVCWRQYVKSPQKNCEMRQIAFHAFPFKEF
jgi:hypothetical protein